MTELVSAYFYTLCQLLIPLNIYSNKMCSPKKYNVKCQVRVLEVKVKCQVQVLEFTVLKRLRTDLKLHHVADSHKMIIIITF